MHTNDARIPLRVPATRRTIRLTGYDYTRPGMYFVTICTRTGAPRLGEIAGRSVRLTDVGRIVRDYWFGIPRHFADVTLDAFVVMPDHVHGIVVINGTDPGAVGAPRHPDESPIPVAWGPARGSAVTAQPIRPRRFADAIPGSLATIVGSFKSAATRRINLLRGTPRTPLWQRNYYEQIIRDMDGLRQVRWYIITNPLRISGAAPA